MRILLDTNMIVWLSSRMGLLPPQARKLVEDDRNELFFSAVSIWEIAIKDVLLRDDIGGDAKMVRDGLLKNHFEELALCSRHAFELGSLPDLHRDPFDRILIAQSRAEHMTLLTSDETIARYPGDITFAKKK